MKMLHSRTAGAGTGPGSLTAATLSVRRLGGRLEPREALPPVVLDDRSQRAEGSLVGAVDARRPLAALLEEARPAQDGEVLADGGPADVERGGDLARGQLLVPEEL